MTIDQQVNCHLHWCVLGTKKPNLQLCCDELNEVNEDREEQKQVPVLLEISRLPNLLVI